jgi:hypothetical protein
MNRTGYPQLTFLRLAMLAVWCVVYGGGTGGLHSILDCHHQHAADTVSHQETNSPHWAGLKSIPSTDSTCMACTSVSAVDFAQVESVVHFHQQDNGRAVDSQVIYDLRLNENNAHPRAPPVS